MPLEKPSRPGRRAKSKPAGRPPPAAPPPAPLGARQILLRSAGIFLVALALRLFHLWQMSGARFYEVLIGDPRQYDAWAQRIAGGDWLGGEVFYQTPLYPYLLAVIYAPLGHSVWAVRLVQALFGATACVFLARAGARFFDERVGLWSGLLLALYPPAIFFDGLLQKASLDLLLMTGMLWILAVAQLRRHWGWFLALGAVLGATTLNRENTAALFPPLLVWIAWLARPAWPRATIAWTAAFAAGAALVLVPVGVRNYYVGGLFALTTSQMGPNFYIGNEANANGTYEALYGGRGDPRYEARDARLLAEQDLKRPLSPGEVSRYWMGRAWHDIGQDPARWLRLLGWKGLLTWHRLEMVDSESLYTHAHDSTVLALLAPVWHLGIVAPLAAVGIWWTRHAWRTLLPLYLTIAAIAAAVTLFYVFARYRYPLVPPVMLFAAAGILQTWDRLWGRRATNLRDWAVAAVLALVASWGCNVSLHQAFDDDAVTYTNAGIEFRDVGRLEPAIDLWNQALRADPRFQPAIDCLGRAALDAGRLDEARPYFERGLALDPHHARTLFSLASVQAELGDDTAALELVERAARADKQLLPALPQLAREEQAHGRHRAAVVALEALTKAVPNNAQAHAELGLALQAAGRTDDAMAELRAALELDPALTRAANNLAWILATSPDDRVRNGAEAVRLAEAACRATDFQTPELLDTLAAAYAETGQFDQAAATCDKALALAKDAPQRSGLEDRRALYQSGRALRAANSRAAEPGPARP